MSTVTFFAPRGKSLRIGSIKFSNHSYVTSNEGDIKKIRNSDGYGKTIFELPSGVSPTDFIKANPTHLGTIVTKPETGMPLHDSISEFMHSKLAEIMDTEARMKESQSSPLLSHTSLMNYNKDTLLSLCKQFGVEHDEADTRKVLISRLKEFKKEE